VTVLLATANPGKQREYQRLLAGLGTRLTTPDEVGLDLEVPEPHRSYAANAADKAAAFARASGLLAVADDSGVEVAALGWGPGPRTARLGGARVTDRVAELLRRLRGERDRRARMVCCLALGIPSPDGGSPRVELFTGVMEGLIAEERRGSGGFGFDPVFVLPSGRTAAELPEHEKDLVSHRGLAVAAALPRLRELLAALA